MPVYVQSNPGRAAGPPSGGKPTDNAYCESFNGKLRAEFPRCHSFWDVAEAHSGLEGGRKEHNEARPHSSLGDRTQAEFLAAWRTPETNSPGVKK